MPTIIDLFAGAGGLSLGASRAGFDLKVAVEIDPAALSTHKLNFPNCKHLDRDIRRLSGKKILSEIGMKKGEVTGLVGGAPCQGFSRIGTQTKGDRRNNLFVRLFRLVSEIRPSFFLVENVPGILDPKFDKVREEAFGFVKGDYALLPSIIVRASDYGAPTTRTRVFFIGYDPKKFSSKIEISDFLPNDKVEQITVEEALRGLPEKISKDWLSAEQGWQPLVKLNGNKFMVKATGDIPVGVGDKKSVKRYKELNQVSSCQGTSHSPELEKRYLNLKHGQRDKISKSVRLDPNKFCPTLRAGTGSDKGSYQAVRPIHHNEPRVITPREAARLQGFPDWFVFHSTKWHSFRQIGNSVSPIVSEYLLKIIADKLCESR